MTEAFHGCKLAYILEDKLLVYQRDDKTDIPYPGLWDFPGGGREKNESPEECVLRELEEEFAITLAPSRLIYKHKSPHYSGQGYSFFFVAYGTQPEIDSIVFGQEGQHWQLMEIKEYLSHPGNIPSLQSRLQNYLKSEKA